MDLGVLLSSDMELGENGTIFGAAGACRDRLGRFVPVGEYFVPDDPCRTCLCDRGIAVACALVQCSQPECDHWQRIEGECCSVKCLKTSNKNSSHMPSFYADTEAGMVLKLLATSISCCLLFLLLVYLFSELYKRCPEFCMYEVDCCNGEIGVDYLHRREDASSDVCRIDRVDVSVSLPSFDTVSLPPPYSPPKLMCVFPAYEEAPPPYESMSGSHSSETVASEQDSENRA